MYRSCCASCYCIRLYHIFLLVWSLIWEDWWLLSKIPISRFYPRSQNYSSCSNCLFFLFCTFSLWDTQRPSNAYSTNTDTDITNACGFEIKIFSALNSILTSQPISKFWFLQTSPKPGSLAHNKPQVSYGILSRNQKKPFYDFSSAFVSWTSKALK